MPWGLRVKLPLPNYVLLRRWTTARAIGPFGDETRRLPWTDPFGVGSPSLN